MSYGKRVSTSRRTPVRASRPRASVPFSSPVARCLLDALLEFASESLPPQLVPPYCLLQFVGGVRVEIDLKRQCFRRRCSRRARTSDHSTSLTAPDSTSPIRLSISAFHASSTPSSGGPSRLASSSAASWARSSTGSFRSASRRASAVSVTRLILSTSRGVSLREVEPTPESCSTFSIPLRPSSRSNRIEEDAPGQVRRSEDPLD